MYGFNLVSLDSKGRIGFPAKYRDAFKEKAEKKVVIKKKFSEDQVKYILTLREENNELSQKDFIKKIELENDIKVSVSTLKKMIDSIY